MKDFLAQQRGLRFSKNEPFNSLLLMLFDYLTPEENDVAEIKAFLREIRSHILSMLLQQLATNGTVETAGSFVKYLLPDPEKFNQIKDTLRIIVEYQRAIARAHKPSLFEEYVTETETPGIERPGLVTALFVIVHMAISHRHQVNASIESPAEQRQAELGCMEELIASCMEILLSFSWSKIYDRNNELVGSGLKYSAIQSVALIHPPKSLDDRILNQLKPSWGFKTTEEIIVAYLIQRPKYGHKLAKFETLYLGSRVYKCLFNKICLTLPPSADPENNSSVAYLGVETEINAPFAKLFYRKLMQNVSAFEPEVRELIFRDLKKMLSNPQLYSSLLHSEDIALGITKYLLRRKYLVNPALKSMIRDCAVTFITYNWGKKDSRSTVTACLNMWARISNAEVFLETSKDLISRLASSPQSDESTFSLLQLLYTFEDFGTKNPLVLASPEFLSVFSALIQLAEKAGMLYFWYPSFGPQSFQHDLVVENDSKCTQREGGVVRVVLRLLFGILLKIGEQDVEPALQTLNFFIFHTKSLCDSEEAALNPKKEESKIRKETTFIQYSLSESIKHEPGIRKRFNTIKSEKGVVQQRTLGDLSGPEKDVYESSAYKLLLLLAYLEQVVIYSALNVSAYKEIPFFSLDSGKLLPPVIPSRVRALILLIGRLVNEYECDFGVSQELEKRGSRSGKFLIKNCFTDIDMIPKDLIEPLHSETGTPVVKDNADRHVDYTFGNYVPGSDSTYSSVDTSTGCSFKEDLIKLLCDLRKEYLEYKLGQQAEEPFMQRSLACLLSANTIKVVQAGLHEHITEDFKYIDKAIFVHRLNQASVYSSHPSVFMKRISGNLLHSAEKAAEHGGVKDISRRYSKAADRFDEMKNILVSVSKNYKEYYGVGKIPGGFWVESVAAVQEKHAAKMEDLYSELRSSILSEKPFSSRSHDTEKMYCLVTKHYNKLLARCPLNRLNSGKKSQAENRHFKTFVKLDLRRDNLDRSMRLKPMKNPLKSTSMLKGLGYMRQFFLKRVLILQLFEQFDPQIADILTYDKSFLVPDQTTETVLTALLEKVNRKFKLGALFRQMSSPRLVMNLGNLNQGPERAVPIEFSASQVRVSRSQLRLDNVESAAQTVEEFEGEIIKIDTSLFGVLYVSKRAITFERRTKEADKPKYRLGCSKEMSSEPGEKRKKEWRLCEIQRIIIRRRNLIRQAFEMRLTNRKSVFILLFSEALLDEFISVLKLKLGKVRGCTAKTLQIIDDDRGLAELVRCKEDWKHKRITNFEYLQKLNFYSGRTFQDMSQYPVFPWILQDYSSSGLQLSGVAAGIYRDLNYPMAGINERKRTEGQKKFDHTEDFPGGPFQYGAHYLPGRAVLGYLMRLQPYAHMLYKFDSGGDCPSRHFHIIEKTWNNVLKETDMNLELIPEFFYNPEFLTNL